MARKVYMVSGGVSKFVKARKDKTFQTIVNTAMQNYLTKFNTFPAYLLNLVR